jgi:hypothetical protein
MGMAGETSYSLVTFDINLATGSEIDRISQLKDIY